MTADFEKILDLPIAQDIKEIGLDIETTLGKRLLLNINRLAGNQFESLEYDGYDLAIYALAKFAYPVALQMIQEPITFSEYKKRRKTAFNNLASLWEKEFYERSQYPQSDPFGLGYELRHDLMSAILISTGHLSLKETELSKGVEENCFKDEAHKARFATALSKTRMSSKCTNLLNETSIKIKVAELSSKGMISAAYIGFFDLAHEAHFQTALEAKKLLGLDGKLFALVPDERLSELQKQKTPIRNLGRRVSNIGSAKGVDYSAPIVLPDSIKYINQATDYFSGLLTNLAFHVRVVGHPSTV